MRASLRGLSLLAAVVSATAASAAGPEPSTVGDLPIPFNAPVATKTMSVGDLETYGGPDRSFVGDLDAEEFGFEGPKSTNDFVAPGKPSKSFVGDLADETVAEPNAWGRGPDSFEDSEPFPFPFPAVGDEQAIVVKPEESSSVGDLSSNFVGDQTFVDADTTELTDAGESMPELSSAHHATDSFSPISHSDMQPTYPHYFESEYRVPGNCDCVSGCDGGCDAWGSRKVGSLLNQAGDTWAMADFLLWFPEQRQSPALITTAPTGDFPSLDQPFTQTAFGGDLGGDLAPGFRIDAGRYLGKRFGFGGRFWLLGQDSDSFSQSGVGTGPSIGRPFFNTNIQDQDAILVNLNNNFLGTASAESSLEMWAAELYGRFRLSCAKNRRLDFIGGYSHFNVEDHLWVASTTVDINSGTFDTFIDQFDATNRFDGGQIGLDAAVTHDRWMFSALTKVHLGNMNQSMNIIGRSSERVAGVTSNFDAGALALDAQGDFERDQFTFVPEVNLKLAYRFRPNVLLSVGYSFLYFDDVVLSGDQVDPVYNGSTLLTNGPYGQQPFAFDSGSLWVQGIDLGFVLDF